MELATAPLRDLAKRLLAEESDRSKGAKAPAAPIVCNKLGGIISKLAGAAGYRSLLSRALALAQAEAPELSTIHVSPDGMLEGFGEKNSNANSEEFMPGEEEVVAHLLGLLHTFIGESLTQQLVKEAWPAIHQSPRS